MRGESTSVLLNSCPAPMRFDAFILSRSVVAYLSRNHCSSGNLPLPPASFVILSAALRRKRRVSAARRMLGSYWPEGHLMAQIITLSVLLEKVLSSLRSEKKYRLQSHPHIAALYWRHNIQLKN